MVATGFTNTFTAGEISEDAQDRTDLQPVAKGCEAAINYVVRIPGPLGKRRGFWRLGDVLGATPSRLVPFKRSVDDALMLEFGDHEVRVWNNNGAPTGVTFASPYAAADLSGLRWKQVADVLYLRHRDGLKPRSLARLNNASWTFADETFPDGPWRPENIDKTLTLTVSGVDEVDANPQAQGGTIFVGQPVTLQASAPIFDAGHVGARFRLRAAATTPSVKSWSAGYRSEVGYYALSNGRVYRCVAKSGHDETVTNPPTQTEGLQSDGGNLWDYRHNGAGIVLIQDVNSATQASGIVLTALPFRSDTATSYFAEGAYSDFRGWPRMWPAMREERLVEGATSSDKDFVDLTETAGFTPTSQTFTPGLGTGAVVATDAVRRRVGEDAAELIWAIETAYLLVGSASGEYIVAGSVLDEPLSPTSVTVKSLSQYGSADVAPVKAHKGVLHVTRGGQTLRELAVDTQQGSTSDDLSVLAQDITGRGMVQLAWVPQPDETLWLRLADGGLAAMVYHKEQQVRGFSRVELAGGFTCEDMAVLPGPGRLDTLWLQVSRVKDGQTQRCLWMLSQKTDALFMDGAELYAGAPVSVVGNLAHYEGEPVRALADGAQAPDTPVHSGQITLPLAASRVLVGLPYAGRFKSLKLDRSLGGKLGAQQRVVGCIVTMKTAEASVAVEGATAEMVLPRTADDVPAAQALNVIQQVTLAGDTTRDPRLIIIDDTAYDSVIYSLQPAVAAGG